jgi:hypothetical protein
VEKSVVARSPDEECFDATREVTVHELGAPAESDVPMPNHF